MYTPEKVSVQHGMIQVHAPSSLWSGTSDTKRKLRAQPSELQEVAIIFARMVEGTYRPVTCEHGTSSLCLDISTQWIVSLMISSVAMHRSLWRLSQNFPDWVIIIGSRRYDVHRMHLASSRIWIHEWTEWVKSTLDKDQLCIYSIRWDAIMKHMIPCWMQIKEQLNFWFW